MGYFEAYRERMLSNNDKLLELGQAIKNLGFRVEIRNGDKKINSFTVYNQEKTEGVRVQFNEVPYRFSFEYDIKPSRENGSGYTGKEFYVNDFEIPFTIDDVIKEMKPMYIDKRFEHYKKAL